MLIRYLTFAAIAIALNMLVFSASKWVLEHIFTDETFFVYIKYFSKLVGIASGFVLKYVLDKKYVFDDSSENIKEEAKKIGIYGLFSVFTTLWLFVISESFERLVEMQYEVHIGWLLGLVTGYLIKYYLDKKFVFK